MFLIKPILMAEETTNEEKVKTAALKTSSHPFFDSVVRVITDFI